MVEKLELAVRKEKELRLTNHVLESENQKLTKKLNKLKIKYKGITGELLSYSKQLEQELARVTREKRKLEETIEDFQQKFSMLRPERKTS
jgi:DNA repair ATPase RecN